MYTTTNTKTNQTMIRVSKQTRARLCAIGRKGQSYDDVICQLINESTSKTDKSMDDHKEEPVNHSPQVEQPQTQKILPTHFINKAQQRKANKRKKKKHKK